jgi:hypothetical protein
MIYHVLIDHMETGEPAIVLLDAEPDAWGSRDRYKAYGRTYYVYCHGEYDSSLLIEIGRAIERKESQTKTK